MQSRWILAIHSAEHWTTSKVMVHSILLPLHSQALAGALVFNPSFKRALESDEDEPLGNKRVKVTDPQNLSPQARQVLDNNELGMELIRRMSILKHEKKCSKRDLFSARRYAVCF